MSSANTVREQVFKYLTDKAFINGRWVAAASGKTFSVTNPATGEEIGRAADCEVQDLQVAIDAAKQAFQSWRDTTAKVRAAALRKLFDLQMGAKQDLAAVLTLEQGKPLAEAAGEIVYGASFMEWFAEEARRVNGEIFPSPAPNRVSMWTREPAGVVAIITPWNFPNAMITRKMAAALAVGCTVVIKPAHDTPYSALALGVLAEQAGIPPGVINVLPCSAGNASQIGQLMCTSPDVAVVSFTGSTGVGKLLLSQAASTVKRVCLELGGNAPFIVFNSADISKAVAGLMASKYRNAGQTCVSANRIYVQSGIYDQFTAALAAEMKKSLKVGDGFKDGVTVGPLINDKAAAKVAQHVQDALAKGGSLQLGSKDPNGQFFEPTLVTNVTQDMLVCREETFGPLAALVKFETEEDVLRMANSSRVGLAGYFYSEDLSQIWRVARRIEVGMVGVNEGMISTCEAPFGGVKESGLGREGAHMGIDEFTEVKYICIGNLKPTE